MENWPTITISFTLVDGAVRRATRWQPDRPAVGRMISRRIMRDSRAEVQFSPAPRGWTLFEHEIARAAVPVSRSAAGAIGATGIVVPIAAALRVSAALDARVENTDRRRKAEPITEIGSAIGELVVGHVRAWRINV